MENKLIMKEAQESLKGKWGISIAACLIATIITILVSFIGGYLINEDWGGNILSLLIFFKYIPFIEESLSFLSFGSSFTLPAQFKFIMPAGISFYTFQTLSYVFDVYKGKVKALPDPIDYFLYVCYFPQSFFCVFAPPKKNKKTIFIKHVIWS